MFNLTLLKKSAIGGFLLSLITPPEVIQTLLFGLAWLIVADIATGVWVAYKYKKESLTSRRFFGKIKQVGVFAIGLWAMVQADSNLQVFGLQEHWGAKLFCGLYAFYELFSLLENLGTMGLPIAKEVKDILLNRKNEVIKKDGEGDKNG